MDVHVPGHKRSIARLVTAMARGGPGGAPAAEFLYDWAAHAALIMDKNVRSSERASERLRKRAAGGGGHLDLSACLPAFLPACLLARLSVCLSVCVCARAHCVCHV